MRTAKTKKYKKIYKAISFLSWLICFGLTAFLIIFMFCGKEDGTPLKELLGSYLYGFLMANIPLVVLSLMIKDKIKPVCWMINVIMSNIIFGDVAIYLVFALWLVDNYLLYSIIDVYKDKYRINKEIDDRE